MQLRAYQDWHIRQAIINKVASFVVPEMTIGQLDFWTNYAQKLHEGSYTPTLVFDKSTKLSDYIFDKPACLTYSGGLESSLISYMLPSVPKVVIEDYFPWTDPIEGAVAICGAGLGYNTVLYGGELYDEGNFAEEEKLTGWEYELTADFAMRWTKYSGSFLLSPFWLIEKKYLFDVAMREGVKFNSCFNPTEEKPWCGECEKCQQISTYASKFNVNLESL
jgi:hypothetical protein